MRIYSFTLLLNFDHTVLILPQGYKLIYITKTIVIIFKFDKSIALDYSQKIVS